MIQLATQKEGDVVIDKIQAFKHNKNHYCIGRVYKGVVEWVGKDFKLHRFQGKRVMFSWESVLKMQKKLTRGEELV